MKRTLLFYEAVRQIFTRKVPGSETLEILEAAKKSLERSSGFICGPNQFVLPSQRALMTASGNAGFIPEDIGFDATAQDDQATCKKAGALIIPGSEDLSVPLFGTTNTFAFTAENDNAPEDQDISNITFVPCRIAGYKDISTLFFQPHNEGLLEVWLRKATAYLDLALDKAVFGKQARSTTIPQGTGYAISTGTDTKAAAIVPDWDDILTLESTVGAAKALRGKLAFVTSPAGAKILQSKYRNTATSHFLMEDGRMAGFPVHVCDQVIDNAGSDAAGSLLIFGNWEDLAIRDYGLLVTVDKFSQAINAKVRLVFNWLVDYRGLRGEVSTGAGTDNYEVAHSFSSIAIKAS